MSNSKSFPLPSGDVAVGIVPIDPATGCPLYSRLLHPNAAYGQQPLADATIAANPFAL